MGMGEIIDKRSLQVILISRLVPCAVAFVNLGGRLTATQAFAVRDLPHRLDIFCVDSPRSTKHAKHVARISAGATPCGSWISCPTIWASTGAFSQGISGFLNSSRSQICCEESLSGSRMVFPAWCRKPCLRSPPRVVSTGLWRYPDLATCMIEVCPITDYDEAD